MMPQTSHKSADQFSWVYHNPVRLHFGEGVFDSVGKAIDGRAYLLVTHPEPALVPWRSRLAKLAREPLLTIDSVESNPSLSFLRQACESFAAAPREPAVIVALGGGSAIDTAKFLAAGRGAFDPVIQYLETGEGLTRQPLPIVAIPTTSGTGSDLTKWATVWDPERSRKLSLSHQALYAESAFVDPRLTATLPWTLTLATGLDALSHALESIWNINANPVTRGLAVSAVPDLMTGLRRLCIDLGDTSARTLMSLGATRAGLAFSNTATALAHNISYPITLDHHVPHGIACSFCLPDVLTAAIGVDAECDAALRAVFGDLGCAPDKLRAFLTDLGVAAEPAEFGISASEWRTIVADGFAGPRGRNFIGSADRFPGAEFPMSVGAK